MSTDTTSRSDMGRDGVSEGNPGVLWGCQSTSGRVLIMVDKHTLWFLFGRALRSVCVAVQCFAVDVVARRHPYVTAVHPSDSLPTPLRASKPFGLTL